MINKLQQLSTQNKEFYLIDEQSRQHKIKIKSFKIIPNDKYYSYLVYDFTKRHNQKIYNLMITNIIEEDNKIIIYL